MFRWAREKFEKKKTKLKKWAVEKYTRKKLKFLRRYLDDVGIPLYTHNISLRFRVLYKLFSPEYKLLPVAEISTTGQVIAEFWPPFIGQSIAPKAVGKQTRSHAYAFPAVIARRFENATVCGTGSALVCRDKALLPDYYVANPHALIEDGTFLIAQRGAHAILFDRPNEKLDRGIRVFGSGATNWYHWLIEILPAAAYAQSLGDRFSDYPLLVPESCLQRPTFRDALLAVAPSSQVRPMKSDMLYEVADLVAIDSPAQGPMNLKPGTWPGVTDYSQHDPALLTYRKLILERLGVLPRVADRRIFLARNNVRRAYNQEELLTVAAGFGFEPVYPETMTFREQVELYHSASLIIGASGAAFANMIFCQPGTRALTWLIPEYDEFCCYSNLAALVGADLNYLFVPSSVNITSSFTAYSAAYVVDPTEFRSALIALGF